MIRPILTHPDPALLDDMLETMCAAEGRVRIIYSDRNGAPHEQDTSGLLAMAIQHVIDHPDGVLILDRAA